MHCAAEQDEPIPYSLNLLHCVAKLSRHIREVMLHHHHHHVHQSRTMLCSRKLLPVPGSFQLPVKALVPSVIRKTKCLIESTSQLFYW